jgi:hypothetical protein
MTADELARSGFPHASGWKLALPVPAVEAFGAS